MFAFRRREDNAQIVHCAFSGASNGPGPFEVGLFTWGDNPGGLHVTVRSDRDMIIASEFLAPEFGAVDYVRKSWWVDPPRPGAVDFPVRRTTAGELLVVAFAGETSKGILDFDVEVLGPVWDPGVLYVKVKSRFGQELADKRVSLLEFPARIGPESWLRAGWALDQ